MGTKAFATGVVGLAVAAVLTLPVPSPGQPPKAKAKAVVADKRINDVLEPIRKRHDVPALAGAIVGLKGVTAVGAVGVRKRGDDTPVTVEDKFHLGSCTKAMTATLIAKLAEDRKLQWVATLDQLFPDLAAEMHADLKTATLAHLLTHHSGLKDFTGQDWADAEAAGDDPRAKRVKAARLALTRQPEGKPGEKFRYANVNYVVAAAAAERAAGAEWEDLLRERVLGPLGMRFAGYGPMSAAGVVTEPWFHKPDGTPVAPAYKDEAPRAMWPSGQVHCSLEDWGKFAADHLKGGRGTPGLLKTGAYQRLHGAPFSDSAYAIGGWVRGGDARAYTLAHDGANGWNYAYARLCPAAGAGVLVATNQGTVDGPGQKACAEAMDALARMAGLP